MGIFQISPPSICHLSSLYVWTFRLWVPKTSYPLFSLTTIAPFVKQPITQSYKLIRLVAQCLPLSFLPSFYPVRWRFPCHPSSFCVQNFSVVSLWFWVLSMITVPFSLRFLFAYWFCPWNCQYFSVWLYFFICGETIHYSLPHERMDNIEQYNTIFFLLFQRIFQFLNSLLSFWNVSIANSMRVRILLSQFLLS